MTQDRLKYLKEWRNKNKKYQKDWELANKDKRKVINQRRRQKLRDWINDYKDRFSCLFCDEDFNGCLEFHHKDPSQKDEAIAVMIGRSCSISKIEDEIKKCLLVCANCHRKIHAGIIKI